MLAPLREPFFNALMLLVILTMPSNEKSDWDTGTCTSCCRCVDLEALVLYMVGGQTSEWGENRCCGKYKQKWTFLIGLGALHFSTLLYLMIIAEFYVSFGMVIICQIHILFHSKGPLMLILRILRKYYVFHRPQNWLSTEDGL